MPSSLLAATTRTIQLIGRQDELIAIHRAIYKPTHSLEIVILSGKGGLGKSRLLEEVLLRTGNQNALEQDQSRGVQVQVERPTWTHDGNAIVSDIVDLNDVKLHAHIPFIHAIRDALDWYPEIDFDDYDRAYQERRQASQHSVERTILKNLTLAEELNFASDSLKNAKKERLVWVIDTAEQLTNFSSDWLLENKLLEKKDLAVQTQQWLEDQIASRKFQNLTLILAGRPSKAMDELRAVAETIKDYCRLTDLPLTELKPTETRNYFQVLAKEAKQLEPQSILSKNLQHLAQDTERLDVLHVYTNGQALLLSLYGDILLEGSAIPEPLMESYTDAQTQIQTKGLEKARYEIEDAFIRLLFGAPSLRGEILKVLVRAPRGLDKMQLHFVLHSKTDDPAESWEGSIQRLKDIEQELEVLRRLSIVKLRPDGRIALQDEIYRIYADHMKVDSRDKRDEISARTRMYGKLLDWANARRQEIDIQHHEIQKKDEENLVIESPTKAARVHFATLSDKEEQSRIELQEKLREWDLEGLHYSLLGDPQVNLNDKYFELAQSYWLASDENAEAMAHAELWRVLKDDNALEFVSFELDELHKQRNEEDKDVLRRVAQQADVIRWLRGFVNENQFVRAIELSEAVERVVNAMPQTNDKERNDKHSWSHTFARGQRTLWRELARIYTGQEVTDALHVLETTVAKLEHLVETPRDQEAFPGERGFKGHRAERELDRVIAIMYNALGYGYTLLGNLQTGVKMYGLALKNLREAKFREQEASTRNNLSRALSDLGRQRARRVCLDALSLRREIGDDYPIALSLNTLALIDNDQGRADRAWFEAAQALAYFKRAENNRGIGLALMQMGEGLRRLARDVKIGRVLQSEDESPLRLLGEAERALKEAIALYDTTEASAESPRLIEALIEMGSIQRDYLDFIDWKQDPRHMKRRYESALQHLERAAQGAATLGIERLRLDAQVNIAWLHYYAKQPERASQILDEILETIDPKFKLQKNQEPPSPLVDAAYTYFQLSKICGLRGKMALEEFEARRREIETTHSTLKREQQQQLIRQDEQAQDCLRHAAEAYVLGIAYTQIFSPRSAALSTLYDSMYDSLKKFNRREIGAFLSYVHQARETYQVEKIKLEDLGDVENFVVQLFGPYQDKGTADAPSA